MKLQLALIAAGATCLLSACATGPTHERLVVREHGRHESVALAVRAAPPAPRQEVIVAAPGPREKFVWDPGHWRWTGHDYAWVPGHWIERPRPRAEWVPAHWVQRHGEWVLIEGRWR